MKLITFLCAIAVAIGSISCENVDLQANLKIFQTIDNASGNVTLPSMDDAKKVLKEKCVNVSGSEAAYTRVVEATETLKECATNLMDIGQLQNDIEEAVPKGELDAVFNKYCRNRTIAIDCLNNFGHALEPCLDPTETDFQRIIINIVTKLLDFICYRDGDMIALFIAENGPKCINEHKDQLIECFNSTFHKYIPTETPTSLPQLQIGAEQCNDMNALQLCVVKQLEKCEESTPANFVESMFKFVRKETVCKV